MKNILLLILFVFIAKIGISQVRFAVDSNMNLVCDSNCGWIHAQYYKPKKTNTYLVNSVAYLPQSFSVGNVLSLNDDKFSGSIPLGFKFCFFENVYQNIYIGANGLLTFNSIYGNQNCSFDTKNSLPFYNTAFPDNAIFCPFVDVNFTQGGEIKYYTTGTAPWRKFVVNYNNVTFFSTTCSGVTNTFQVVLYETSNIIEFNIQIKNTCNNDTANWLNYSTLGIQNTGAITSFTATGKNASIWTAANTSFQFVPNGANNFEIKWYDFSNIQIAANVDSVRVCASSFPTYYKARYIQFCPLDTLFDTVIVTKNQIQIDSVTQVNPTCPNTNNGSLVVYPANPNWLYKLNNGNFQSSNVFSNLGPGLYTVLVKDASNCIDVFQINLLPISNLGVFVDTIIHPNCGLQNGYAMVHGTGGTPPYSYAWSNGSTQNFISNVAPGTYTVYVTDAAGCIKSEQIVLVSINNLGMTSTVTNPVCGDSSGKIVLNITGAVGPFTISWSNGVIGNTISNIPEGSYTASVIDSLGCTKSWSFNLVNTLLVKSIRDTIHTSCGLNNGKATVHAFNSIGPYSFLWTNSSSTDSTADNLGPGIYVCTTTAANGCKRKDTFLINASIAPTKQLSKSNAYCDSSNGTAILFYNNMASPVNFLWSNGSTSNPILQLAPGMYIVTATDQKGCVIKDTAIIGNDGSPHLKVIGYTPPLCYGDSTASVTLTAFGGTMPYKYSTDGVVFQTVSVLNNMPGGSYVLYVRDANSCIKDTMINFPQPPKLDLTFRKQKLKCYDDKGYIVVQGLGGTPTYSYAKNPSNNFNSKDSFYNLSQGSYSFKVKDIHNCEYSETVQLEGPSSPLKVEFETIPVPCYKNLGGEIKATINGGWGGYSFLWSNGDNTKLEFVNQPSQKYILNIKDAEGCNIRDSAFIDQLKCCDAYLPNAFTPNEDNKNDLFKVITASEINYVSFKIYNRYGQLVYYSTDENYGWDGTFNNQRCEIGMYIYILDYYCKFSRQKFTKTGEVNLIR